MGAKSECIIIKPDFTKTHEFSLKKATTETSNSIEMTVYSKNRYQLAHLLEKGHALRQGGRAKAYPHIAPAEEAGETMLVQLIEKALS